MFRGRARGGLTGDLCDERDPATRARRMVCVRSVTWSLAKMLEMWLRTDFGHKPSRGGDHRV